MNNAKTQIAALRERLSSRRISKRDIEEICTAVSGPQNDFLKEELYRQTRAEDTHVAWQALWALSHLGEADNEWLLSKHDELIDAALAQQHDGCRRLTLNILLRQPFPADSLRGDFVDYCLQECLCPTRPAGIRALAVKLAYEQCCHYPELLSELRNTLEMMEEQEALGPAERSAAAAVIKKMKKNSAKRMTRQSIPVRKG